MHLFSCFFSYPQIYKLLFYFTCMLVGIVGKPSAGKSTFFKAATLADAEIASYPFTTIKPNHGIGFVKVNDVAQEIAKKLKIPIFSIGAGRHCDGQLLLSCDLLGTFDLFTPKFVKCYATNINIASFLNYITCENFKSQDMDKGKALPTMARLTEFLFKLYVKDVKEGKFPAEKHVYHMKQGEYNKLMSLI